MYEEEDEGELMPDAEYQHDKDSDDEDEAAAFTEEREEDLGDGSGSMSDSDSLDSGRDAVERLKDDLFAEEDDADGSQEGEAIQSHCKFQ